MADKHVVKRLIAALDRVLNGHTLCFVMDSHFGEIATEDQVKELVALEEFDQQILKADFEQQEGDLFHDLVGPGDWQARARHFPRKEPTLTPLNERAGRDYLQGMLTCLTQDHFWSPYQTQWRPQAAGVLIEEFLAWATAGKEFQMYQLDTDFIFDQAKSEVDLYYWDRLGSDSCTVIVSPGRLLCLFTNGSD